MRISKNVHQFEFDKKYKALLLSDVHWDNPHCNRDLLRNHLDEAKRIGAKVFVNGDLFCLMQGKGDPRRSKEDIRHEHNNGRYLDSIVETAVEWFAPYADTLVFVGYGNHENSIIRHQETDILQRFVDQFNMTYKPEQPIEIGGYGGVLVFLSKDRSTAHSSYTMKYFHGSGGGGVVTKGVIQNNRLMAQLEGYDAIWQGHIHELYHHTDVVESYHRLHKSINLRNVNLIRTSTYKEEYGDGSGGWHIERGAPAKPLGGYWMELEKIRKRAKNTDSITIYPTFTQCTRMY